MGIIRFILALSVILAHVGTIYGYNLIGGKIAVQSFFMISGFYMALVLSEKYRDTPHGIRKFYVNRLLRIYPLYFVILILTGIIGAVLLAFHQPSPFDVYKSGILPSFRTLIYLITVNITIIGQDIGMFFDIHKNGDLFFSPTLSETRPYVYHHLLIPQAWSLDLELLFYLLAPVLVRLRIFSLVVFLFVSLGIRITLNTLGLHHEPWINKFFPTELFFFMTGILSYHVYHRIPKTDTVWWKLAYILFLCATFLYGTVPSYMNHWINPLQWVYFGVLACCLPFFFSFFKKSTFDRWMGELSYPMYVSHVLVFWVMQAFHFPDTPLNLTGLLTIICTVLFSIFLVFFIALPAKQLKLTVQKNYGKK